ncbi:ABC transporter substrate-binding protein [Paenibacillus sp. FSL H8-0457]|uniref:ABC transporter substrate-binding protein n=1 Tax=Bacillales TaxID=1385 RepID=UPI0003E27DFC|nr:MULTISPECIES: ABC transporter substrate-binding protein [Paenibacillus]ETT64736.1 family 1 extracellular solute-binding protein [Paenibacillus sp. FSL H8-457]MCM3260314.1 ABC transporter substrate-binding protein [Paenibacillus lautus]
MKKHYRKKSFHVLLMLLLAFSTVLSACSGAGGTGGKAGQDGKVEIQLWSSATAENAKPIEDAVAKFNESQDDIVVKTLSNQDHQKQLTAISGGSAPDLIVTQWNNIGPWSAAGAVQSLEEFIKRDGFDTSQIIPAALDRMKVNNDVFGFPISMSMANKLFYNKKAFEEAGLTAPPETLEDLFEYSKKLTKKDDKGNITQMGFIPDYPWIDNVFWPIIFNGSWDDGNGKLTANQEANVKAIDYQVNYYKEFGQESIDKFKSGMGGLETPQDPILTGKLAMIIGWENWYVEHRGEGKEVGVAPFPYPAANPDLKGSGMVSPIAMFIPSKAKHQEEAWKVMQYLLGEDVQIEYSIQSGSIPVLMKALDNPKLTENQEVKELWDYYESAKNPNLKGFPNSIYINEYLQTLNEETEKALKGQISAQEAMDNVVSKMQPIADKK